MYVLPLPRRHNRSCALRSAFGRARAGKQMIMATTSRSLPESDPVIDAEQHQHEAIKHSHPHFHVTHNHVDGANGFEHLSSHHEHEHDHAAMTHSHRPHEDFDSEHQGEAHIHDHAAPARARSRSKQSS